MKDGVIDADGHVLEDESFVDYAYQVERVGNQHFLFASDFPHEIGPDQIFHEIDEVRHYPGLTEKDKEAILADNAKQFYQFAGVE